MEGKEHSSNLCWEFASLQKKKGKEKIFISVSRETDQALYYAQKAVNMDPKHLVYREHFVNLLNRRKNFFESMLVILDGLKATPEWMNGPRLLKDAEENFIWGSKLLEIYSGYPEGRIEEIHEFLDLVLEYKTDFHYALDLKAELLYRAGKYQEAEKYLVKALVMNRNDKRIRNYLCRALWNNNKKVQAALRSLAAPRSKILTFIYILLNGNNKLLHFYKNII